MDLNELLYRHQLALMSVKLDGSKVAITEAANMAQHFTQEINGCRTAQTLPPAVLSVRTLVKLHLSEVAQPYKIGV